MTKDTVEKPVWLNFLGLDVNEELLSSSARIWVGHFMWIDINVICGNVTEDTMRCDGITFDKL